MKKVIPLFVASDALMLQAPNLAPRTGPIPGRVRRAPFQPGGFQSPIANYVTRRPFRPENLQQTRNRVDAKPPVPKPEWMARAEDGDRLLDGKSYREALAQYDDALQRALADTSDTRGFQLYVLS